MRRILPFLLLLTACGRVHIRSASFDSLTIEERKRADACMARVSPAIVGILSSKGYGTGVIVHPKGVVLTAEHILSGSSCTVTLHGGKTLRANVLVEDAVGDRAVIRLPEGGPYPFVPIAESFGYRTPVLLAGVGREERHWSAGRILMRTVNGPATMIESGDNDEDRYFDRSFIHSAPGFPGDSGGPLFDLEGRLVGINVMVLGTDLNFTLANRAAPFLPLLDELVRHPNRRSIREASTAITTLELFEPPPAESAIEQLLEGLAEWGRDEHPDAPVDQIAAELRTQALKRARILEEDDPTGGRTCRWLWREFHERIRKKPGE